MLCQHIAVTHKKYLEKHQLEVSLKLAQVKTSYLWFESFSQKETMRSWLASNSQTQRHIVTNSCSSTEIQTHSQRTATMFVGVVVCHYQCCSVDTKSATTPTNILKIF